MQNCGISAGSPCDHLEFSNLALHLSPLNFSNMNQANYTYFPPEKCKKRPFHGFEPGFEPIFLDQTSVLRARSAARSAARRVAAPLENLEWVWEGIGENITIRIGPGVVYGKKQNWPTPRAEHHGTTELCEL